MPIKGIVIAGTHSGCGKTTITLGVLSALKKKGITVQSFKAGPDFIDSGLHKIITGRPSRNLDAWMCGRKYVKDCFKRYSADADMAVVEGVMGMFDGEYNTAKLARLLNLPVILVVDAYGMAESAGAIVTGFSDFGMRNSECGIQNSAICNPQSAIGGIIFNRVASERHYERLKRGVSDVKVLGYLPRDLDFEIPHRHLGLAVAEENPIADENIERLAVAVLEYIGVDAIINLAGESVNRLIGKSQKQHSLPIHLFTHSPVVAVAYDRAFCFYYEDNLDLLRKAGAEIITFSPLSDSKIPDGVDAIYIGGGYPELYAKELSGNAKMLKSIKKWSDAGKPLYAECGGLMYLSQGIYDFEENFLKMASIFPFKTQMKKGRAHLGYREIELKDNCMLGKKGDRVRGHEFHYSEVRSEKLEAGNKIYSVSDNSKKNLHGEGYRFKKTLASYVHIHFGSNLSIAKNFIDFIKEH